MHNMENQTQQPQAPFITAASSPAFCFSRELCRDGKLDGWLTVIGSSVDAGGNVVSVSIRCEAGIYGFELSYTDVPALVQFLGGLEPGRVAQILTGGAGLQFDARATLAAVAESSDWPDLNAIREAINLGGANWVLREGERQRVQEPGRFIRMSVSPQLGEFVQHYWPVILMVISELGAVEEGDAS